MLHVKLFYYHSIKEKFESDENLIAKLLRKYDI